MTKRRVVRRRGYMKGLSRVTLPRHLLYFDTETWLEDDENGITHFPLRLGVAIYNRLNEHGELETRKTHRFETIGEFISLLDQYNSMGETVYLVAHNIGFDVRVLDLPRRFAVLGWENKPPIINQRVFIWDVKGDKGRFTFLDTANYGVRSVTQLGADMGYEKLTVDFDNVSDDDLYTYCQRDVEILEQFMVAYIRFLVEGELGAFKVTIASQALTAFRTRFMANPPFIHNHDESLSLERDAYHGGRTECWFIGDAPKGDYYYVDINSMYPFAMVDRPLPLRLKGYTENVPIEYMKVRLYKYHVIADVTLETDEPVYPALRENKLLFPIGEIRVQLHQSELSYAYFAGHLKKIHRCAVYEKGPLFDEYVTHFYQAKAKYTLEDNKTWRYISKLFLNSLYGKFGQLQPHREIVGKAPPDQVWSVPILNKVSGQHYQEVAWFGDVFREWRAGETALSIPAIAGAITARARMLLWGYIKRAGVPNVFYMDTDSLIVNRAGYERLGGDLDDVALGKLKLEDHSDRLSIYGPKDYVFGDTIKVKGVPKKATVIEDGMWQYLQFQGFKTWLKYGASGPPTGQQRVKRRRSAYTKGVVGDNGYVSPHHFDSS